jgi:hypothetical protein
MPFHDLRSFQSVVVRRGRSVTPSITTCQLLHVRPGMTHAQSRAPWVP